MEQRTFSSFYSNLLVFPGGNYELDKDKNLIDTLKREIKEELNVDPVEIAHLNADYISRKSLKVKPFIITRWKGQIPGQVLDQGNSLVWIKIQDLKDSPLEQIQKIGKVVERYLNSNH